MLLRRFGFAKATTGDFSTPALVDCDSLQSGKVFGDEVERKILYPPSIKQREIKIDENFYLIPNGNDLLRNAREFVDYTRSLRKKYGYGAIFYIPGVPSYLYPILFYMGYDVFDNCHSKIECTSIWGSSNTCMSPRDIFQIVISAFNEGRLRELVEGVPNNKSQELLRYFDLAYWKEQEQFYPVYVDSLNAVSMNSLFRPDILRWRDRLKRRYTKPNYARNLLLIPCSARKPYSESKSHRLMAKYIRATMHEVILTSPLGVVPRELESFYPAKSYDIPVIGHWYEEEKKMIREMLAEHLLRFKYENIIAYLPESMRFIEDILESYDAVMIWGKELDRLAEETKKLNYRVKRSEVLRQNLSVLARFQFGVEFDFSQVRIRGRYPRIDVLDGTKRLFGYDIHRGMLTLAEESAKRLVDADKYVVEIDDFWPEGDVFAAGIINARDDIRESDEVAVVHEGELRGWGIAKMSAYDMVNEAKGKAVKIRNYPRNKA